MKKLVFTFGRMNPPTAGHQKLVDKVKSVAKTAKADARIYLSHTQNKKKDPLDYQDKIRFATKAFGSIVTKSQSKTIIQILQEIQNAGYTDVVLVVGSDRVKDFDALLKKYNGKDYTFNSVRTQSAGTRDPDAEGVEGMSASKLRQLATEGNFNEFKSGLPKSIQTMAKAIYDKLRSVMEEEDKQLDETVLTVQQRQKRARLMKRLSRKLSRRRAMRKTRMADSGRLEKRARKKAVEFLRKKFAGDRGQHYHQLSPSEKISVDRLVDKKKGMVAKLAKKMMPKVRKGEVERVRAARSSKNEQALNTKAMQNLREKAEKADVEFEAVLAIYEHTTIDPTSTNNDEQQRFQAVNHYVAEAMSDEQKKKLYDAAKKLRDSNPPAKALQKTNREVLGVKKQKTYSEMMQKREDIDESKVADAANKLSDYVLRTTGLGTTNAKGEKIVYTGKVPTQDKKEDADPCWKGYEMVGKKKKDGKEVPNCVPVKEEKIDEVSADTLHSYIKKSKKDGDKASEQGDHDKAFKRTMGRMTATGKLIGKKADSIVKNMGEEKQIDEIGLGVVTRYLAKRIGQSLTKKAGDVSKKSVETQIKNTANAKKRIDKAYGGKPQLVQSPAPTKPAGTVKSLSTTSSKRPMPASSRAPANDPIKEAVSPEKSKKTLKDILPKSGAGQMGTDELTNTLKKGTPGQVSEDASVNEALKMARGEVFRQMKAFLSDYIDKAGDKELVHVAKMMGKTLTKQGAKYVLEHMETAVLEESEYQGKKVTLNDPFRTPGGPKKFSVYVKNEKGNVVKVNFGDPNMEIKRDDPERRKAYRSRHGCDNPGPKTKANYWSCQQWRAGKKVDD